MVGGMGVRKNQFIEDWAGRRENFEHVFKFTRGMWARLAIFGFAVPYGVFHMISTEMVLDSSAAMANGPVQLGYKHSFLGGYEQKDKPDSAAAAEGSEE